MARQILALPIIVTLGFGAGSGRMAFADTTTSSSSHSAPSAASTAPGASTSPDEKASEKSAVEKPAAAKSAAPKSPSDGPAKPAPVGVGELAASDRALVTELLAQVGALNATLRSMERTPERQVAVMLRLAEQDLAKAKTMYCSAGDRVLERFDAQATHEKNQAAMLEALVAVLPEARAIGCLNHIRNSDVLSVDVNVGDVPEAQRAQFVKAAEALVSAGKIARFLAPPREPDAFHFEFKRRPE